MDEDITNAYTYSIFDEGGAPIALDVSYEDFWDWARINDLIIYYKNDIPRLAREFGFIEVGTYRIEAKVKKEC